MDKICTSLEQSYKLLKLKFDSSTTDMCWVTKLFGESLPDRKVLCISPKEYRDSDGSCTAIPSWSLPALMGLVTSGLKSSDIRINFCKSEGYPTKTNIASYSYHVRCTFTRVANGTRTWGRRYTNTHEELLDAMFELVCLMRKESLL